MTASRRLKSSRWKWATLKTLGWSALLLVLMLVASGLAWRGVDGFAAGLVERRLDSGAQAIAQAATASLGRLQTRVLIENARFADGRAEFGDVVRAIGNESLFVSRVETRDTSGNLQQSSDLTAALRMRDDMGSGRLMSLYSAVSANTVVLSSPYAVRDNSGGNRSHVDLFSPIGRGDRAFLIVSLSLDTLLDEAIRAAGTGLASGLSFRFDEISRSPKDTARTSLTDSGVFQRAVEVRYADLALLLVASNRDYPGPEFTALRWVITLLSAVLALVVPLLIRNVLVRRQAQRDLRNVEEKVQIEARFATLGEMSVAIAHELNQPLAAIENFAFSCERMLQRPDHDPASLRTGLAEIRSQAKRSADVIRSIRQFVRRREAPAALVDVNEVLSGLKMMLDMQANTLGCRMEIECQPDLRLWCQRTLLEQVTLNLARNGFEAMAELSGLRPEDRLLRIRAEAVATDPFAASPVPDRLRLRVSDRGHGISDQAAQQIFKPFFSTKENGLGIGLSLCQSMVEREGGSLSWENNPNGGATFTLELPIQQGPLGAGSTGTSMESDYPAGEASNTGMPRTVSRSGLDEVGRAGVTP